MCDVTSHETISVWLTDGSPVRFTDTVGFLVEPHSTLPFFRTSYEGLLDPAVFVGYGCIAWQQGGHDAELEWALIFDEPLASLTISPQTPCVLQGMIEGKNLELLTGTDPIPWKPSSLGNNVMATSDQDNRKLTGGIRTNLGELIEDWKGAAPIGSMSLSYPCINGSSISRRTVTTKVLKNVPILAYVDEVARRSEELGLRECRVLNLGANGEESGFVKARFRQAGGLLRSVLSADSWGAMAKHNEEEFFHKTANQVRHWLVREVLDKEEGMARKGKAELLVVDRHGEPVGSAILEAR